MWRNDQDVAGGSRDLKTIMYKCKACESYTLEVECPKCKAPTSMPLPARFSPEDHYGKYRRRLLRGK